MYPETDLPLLKISREMIDEVKKKLPKLRSEVRGELESSGLTGDLIMHLIENNLVDEYKALLRIIKEPKFIGKIMVELPKEISSHEGIKNIENILNLDIISSIVRGVRDEKIQKQDVKHIMTEIAKGKSFEDAIKIEKIDLSEIEQKISKLVKEKPGLSIGGYMGLVMSQFKGKVNGKDATEILNKLIR
jgi:glutamyl-tRNA(Gln) amidotransferase subunit E